jgi:hypothetical protein
MKNQTRRVLTCSRDTARRRVRAHPLSDEEIVEVVLAAWAELAATTTPTGLNLVSELGIAPRAIGDLLEKLIVRRLANAQPELWRGELCRNDKDVVCLQSARYSFEIKTSTSKASLAGNKSYASSSAAARKSKHGYYLVVNYDHPQRTRHPQVRSIRFGWLDHEDWQPQSSDTGQRARIRRCDATRQLVTLYEA